MLATWLDSVAGGSQRLEGLGVLARHDRHMAHPRARARRSTRPAVNQSPNHQMYLGALVLQPDRPIGDSAWLGHPSEAQDPVEINAVIEAGRWDCVRDVVNQVRRSTQTAGIWKPRFTAGVLQLVRLGKARVANRPKPSARLVSVGNSYHLEGGCK